MVESAAAQPAAQSAGQSDGQPPAPPTDTLSDSVEPMPEEAGIDEDIDGESATLLPVSLVVPRGRPPAWLRQRKLQLDALLNDTAQDLGLLIDVSAAQPGTLEEAELPALAAERGELVILPRLRLLGGDDSADLELQLWLAQPDDKLLLSRVERLGRNDLAVRSAVMFRDLVTGRSARKPPKSAQAAAAATDLVEPARSAGRVILATNGTLYGGFLGYSIQRAARSDDPRLLYPMIAVGAGVGLGASVIVADEWNVGVGDAWYLAAGAWWPAVAGHLIYEGRFGDKPGANEDEPWTFGLVGSATGLTLSTVGLLSRGMGDGGAAMAHSGGALGVVVGGLAEFAVSGNSDGIPFGGMGYGAGAGWLIGSAAAISFHPAASDVLAIDLGLTLGGLAGASAASPLLFGDQAPEKTRGWVAATGGGLIAGGVIAWYLSRDDDEPAAVTDAKESAAADVLRMAVPTPAMIGRASLGEINSPGFGFQWHGKLW